jgi:outer membrane protein assembly factor BamB/predicted phosphodiesterase
MQRINKQIVLSLTIIFFSSILNAQLNGRVYIDNNENGIYESGETLLPGVKVSDGMHVVITSEKGEYILKGYNKTRFIYITVPAGYKTVDKFYTEIDDNKDSYNFGLVKHELTANSTKFIQITDTEVAEYGDWIKDTKEYSKQNEIGFIVHTGDICYEDGLKFHASNINSKTMDLPIYYCIGNHDLVKGKYGEELYESLFGPVYYSFDAGNTHFVVTPMLHGDYKPSYTKKQVYKWLKNDLENTDPSMNLVVFNHDLLKYDDEDFIYSGGWFKKINLNKHNLVAWIYGHWHINFMKQHGKNGPFSICSSPPDKGGINHSPSNFMEYEISKNGKLRVTPRYTYIDKQLVINSPITSVDKQLLENFEVSVNSYNTVSATAKIGAELSNQSGKSLKFGLSRVSDWNWRGRLSLDDSWATSAIKIKVLATYKNGKTKESSSTVEIANENNVKPALKLQWSNNIKGNIWMAKSLVVNNIVYSASIDDFKMINSGISALNAKTGEVLWQYKTEGSVDNTFCYENGKILVTDYFGIAYALDAISGKLVWKKILGQRELGNYNTGNVVNNGVFFTGYAHYLKAIDVETGNTIWRNNSWKGGEGSTHTMIVADNVLIAASNWRALYAHNSKTGSLIWENKTDQYRSRSSSAAWQNDTLYVAGRDEIGLFDIHSGKILKSIKTDFELLVSTKPLVVDNMIIMGTNNNGMVALDRYTGNTIWSLKTNDALIYTSPYSKPTSCTVETPPIIINGAIVFGASDGYVYVVDITSGKLIDKVNLGAPIFSAVTPYKDGFIVGDFGSNIYYFKLNITK